MNSKVTLVIPVYNGAEFLGDAIRSALQQTSLGIEIIVVNDGSTDDNATERIALSFGSQIRYFSKPNGGVGSALNLAIHEMQGDYFSWLSHDDLYLPQKIEHQLRALQEHESCAIAYGDHSIFTHDPGRAIKVRLRQITPPQFRCWLTLESALHGCSLLIPRHLLTESGGFREDLQTTQDYDLWFRLARVAPFVHVPGNLVLARNHPGQGSHRMSVRASIELDLLHSSFIEQLRSADIRALLGPDLARGYLAIARTMHRRHFVHAAELADNLARKHGASAIAVASAGLTANLQSAITKMTYPLIGPMARQRIKQALRPSITNSD